MSAVSILKRLYKNPSVKSVSVYTFTNFFGKAVSFLLLFVFTNPAYISPSENGLLSLFSNSMLFLMPFLSMGIIHSTSADFFKMPKNEFRDFFTTGFVMPFAIMIVSAVILFYFREKLKLMYGFPYMFAWLIPLITFFTFCGEQLLGLVRNNNEPNTYFTANVSKTILELGISFVLVVFFAWRWQGRIAGILVSYIFIGGYGLYYFIKKNFFFGKLRKEFIVSELVYAIPIIALQASIFCMNSSDKFFLSSFTNDDNQTVGIYSVACVFASVLFILCTALQQYVFPKIFLQLSSNDIDYAIIGKHFWIYVGIMFAALILLICFTPLAYHFINLQYHSALQYLFLLCIGNFLWAISYFFYSFLLYYKEKKKILVLSVYCIGISLVLNYFLISHYGALGAAVSTIATYFIVLILTLFLTKSYWIKLYINISKK